MKAKRFSVWFLIALLIGSTLACRTAETITQLRAAPPATRARATKAPTRVTKKERSAVAGSPTAILAITDEPAPATQAPPPPPQPTAAPAQPTRKPPPAQPQATDPPTPLPAASPTPAFKFKIQESRCGPNVRTYIEGYVYENNVPKNDVLVRISQGPDGQPDPNEDYRTGTDPRQGYFFQNIDANAPHGGTWYLWVIDPGTQQRVSEIAIVKTDPQRVEDTENSAGSCQSATIKFSTTGASAVPTPRPSHTPNPNASPTPTQDPGDDS